MITDIFYSLLFWDPVKFKHINRDLTKTRETKLQNYLLKMKKENMISEEVYQKIRPTGSRPGVMYGLPKIHKENVPFRPILSSINTYNYKLASYLVDILQPISTNAYSVKNSFSFSNWINNNHTNGVMCSYDV